MKKISEKFDPEFVTSPWIGGGVMKIPTDRTCMIESLMILLAVMDLPDLESVDTKKLEHALKKIGFIITDS